MGLPAVPAKDAGLFVGWFHHRNQETTYLARSPHATRHAASPNRNISRAARTLPAPRRNRVAIALPSTSKIRLGHHTRTLCSKHWDVLPARGFLRHSRLENKPSLIRIGSDVVEDEDLIRMRVHKLIVGGRWRSRTRMS